MVLNKTTLLTLPFGTAHNYKVTGTLLSTLTADPFTNKPYKLPDALYDAFEIEFATTIFFIASLALLPAELVNTQVQSLV